MFEVLSRIHLPSTSIYVVNYRVTEGHNQAGEFLKNILKSFSDIKSLMIVLNKD